jgi:hypothetical protein
MLRDLAAALFAATNTRRVDPAEDRAQEGTSDNTRPLSDSVDTLRFFAGSC